MDGLWIQLGYIVIDLILPLWTGYILKERHWMTQSQCDRLIRFGVVVLTTILCLLSCWILPLRGSLLLLPVFGGLASLVPWSLVKILHRQEKFQSLYDKGSYIITSIPSNQGTVAGICSFIAYGEIGFAYVQIICLMQVLMLLFVCFPLGYYYKAASTGVISRSVSLRQLNWRRLFLSWNQLGAAGLAIGLVLNYMGVPRPAVLGELFQGTIHFTAWATLLPIGYMIEFHSLKAYYWKTLDLLPIKCVATPVILAIPAWFLFRDPVLLGTVIITMAAPCANNALITTRLYGLNTNLSMSAFITTIAAFVLVLFPLFYLAVANGLLPLR